MTSRAVAPAPAPARSPARFRLRPLLAALLAGGLVAPGAHAATIKVTTGGDAGNASTCTLRQAVERLNFPAPVGACTNSSANDFGTDDRVDLTGLSGTIALAGGAAVSIGVDMAIVGTSATALTISGGGAGRVFEVPPGAGPDIVFSGLTLADGRSKGPGGCIYNPGGVVDLRDAVVTGCRAQHDPMGALPSLNGLGGGVFAYLVVLEHSTVSGNVAQTAGGGIGAGGLLAYHSRITGNTVTGQDCTFDPDGDPGEQKYCLPAAFGGGGAFAVANTLLQASTVSGNTLNASTLGDGTDSYRLGWGGGIASFSKYDPADELVAAGKSASRGARALFPTASPAAQARMRASFARQGKGATPRGVGPGAKADGDRRFTMLGSTLGGNRVLGGDGPAPTVGAKYGGGGAAFYARTQNAEIANSTVSGNTLPPGGNCAPAGEPPFMLSCGAGLSGDSFELFNSTVTGNVGWSAVERVKYSSGPRGVSASKALARFPRIDALHARWSDSPAGRAAKRTVAKAASRPVMQSTIVAGNVGRYDVGCTTDCTISGANSLVRRRQSTVTFDVAPIDADAQLAPLADNGGSVAGAPGAAGTAAVPTHALYAGSPAIDAGSDILGFAFDQRGTGFPRQVGASVDIGAFEGAIARPVAQPVPGLGPAGLALLGSMLAFAAAYLRRRRTGQEARPPASRAASLPVRGAPGGPGAMHPANPNPARR